MIEIYFKQIFAKTLKTNNWKVLNKNHPKHVWMMPKSCPDDARMMPKTCPNDAQNMSETWTKHVWNMTKSNLKDDQTMS